MGGLMSITGAPGGGPMRVGIPVADLSAGLFCALGVLTALLEREVSGEGQWVSTSLLQAQIFMLDFQASRYLTEGEVPKQAGNNHPTSIPTGVFKTADGYLNLAIAGQVIWERFCNAAGRPDWITSPNYKTGKLRLQNRDALNADIDKVTVTKSSADWVSLFNKVGVPCGPIYAVDQVFADPQVRHLGIAKDSARSDGSHLGLLGQPFTLSRTGSTIAARPPNLGEHTDEVLTEFGFSADEIKALHDAKAL
jgi:formyl-CoA transferase